MRRVFELNRSLLSPLVAFTAIWVLGALLSQFHLLSSQRNWSALVIGVVAIVPVAFIAGGLIGEGLTLGRARIASAVKATSQSRAYRNVLIVLFVIGCIELAHQFAKIGGIPLLSPGGSTLRFSQGGPTIVLIDGLTVVAIAGLVRPKNLFSRESRFELLLALAALTGFALQAGRGSVLLPVIVAVAARWLYWGRPRGWMFVAAGLLAFAAVVFGFYLRTRQNPYNPFESELFGEILPGVPFFLQPLVPIYLAITTNFLALQGVIGHFPTGEAFGGGVFDAIGLDTIFHSARNVSDVSASITPPWVTSTVAGPLWADGGFIALIPGIAATGFFSAGAFAMATRTRSFRWSMIAGYLLYLAIFGVYTNLWTQQLDWLLVIPLLLIVGAIAEDPADPPGLTGRVWGRIRQMRERMASLEAPAKGDEGDLLVRTEPPDRQDRRLGRWLILGGVAIVALLLVSGVVIQRVLPEPYPLVASMPLPQGSATADGLMTNSDRPNDNEPIQWVRGRGHRISVFSYVPGEPRSEVERVARMKIPENAQRSQFDVSSWYPWRSEALFSFEQRSRNLAITVSPTWRSDGKALSFLAPLSEPPKGMTREFSIGSWGGKRPDLFVITRGDPASRPVLQILSSESGFRRQLYAARLPYRGLSPRTWSVQIAPIVGLPDKSEQRIFKGDRLDLVLINHDPDEEHSMVHVVIGESGFEWDAIRRDLDASAGVPRGTEFLIGSHLGATAIYEIQPRDSGGPLLQVFGLTNPPPLQ